MLQSVRTAFAHRVCHHRQVSLHRGSGPQRRHGGLRLALVLIISAALLITGCEKEKEQKRESESAAEEATKTDKDPTNPESRASEVATFKLGIKLSLLMMTRAKGVEKMRLKGLEDEVNTLAGDLGIDLPDPYRLTGDPAQDEAAAVDYLLAIVAEELGPQIREKLSPSHASLLEFAVKTNLLLILYLPGDADSAGTNTQSLMIAADKAAEMAGVPPSTYKKQFELIRLGATYDQMKRAIQQAHENVYQYLISGAVPEEAADSR